MREEVPTTEEYRRAKRRHESRSKRLEALESEYGKALTAFNKQWKKNRQAFHRLDDQVRMDAKLIKLYEAEQSFRNLGFERGDIVEDEFGNRYRVSQIYWTDFAYSSGVEGYKLNKDGSPGGRSVYLERHWKKVDL